MQFDLRKMNAEEVLRVRESTGLTPEAFCTKYHFNLPDFMAWESGTLKPGIMATAALHKIESHPEQVEALIARNPRIFMPNVQV